MKLLYKSGPMESLRKWFYRPKRDDSSLLAQFFFADDALNLVAAELDSFDGRKDPERCSMLVNQLRHAQDRVLNITSQIMDQLLGEERVARGFRVKFPEDVLQDNLAGQLWFGAECLAAGSSIMNREEESAAMRPLARALTRSLETVRALLRERCLRPRAAAAAAAAAAPLHDDMLLESLKIFDRLFADFELCYVCAMVSVKTPQEFEAQQLICVLFSESLRRALKRGLLTQEQVDSYDPALMFAVPRLAIVGGLLAYVSGPLSLDKALEDMSDMFRPFRTLLQKIRSLLWTLERREMCALERLLCNNEHAASLPVSQCATAEAADDDQYPDVGEFVSRFYADHGVCRDLYPHQSSIEASISDSDYQPDAADSAAPAADRATDAPTPAADQHSKVATTLRNLSSSGLVTSVTSERPLPDNDLVTSLDDQVTEIADRLNSLVTDIDILVNTHSVSHSDVPTLMAIAAEVQRGTDYRSNAPSTSHGYLIPNAISQEPAVLASLSHNSSAVFNDDEEARDNDIAIMLTDNIDAEIVNANISIANANLSSLLLTNEEYRNTYPEDDKAEDKVTFTVGYESDHDGDSSPTDSGVSTENTSLDRSPDADAQPGVAGVGASVGAGVGAGVGGSRGAGGVRHEELVDVAAVETSCEEERRRVLEAWGMHAGAAAEQRALGDALTELRRHRRADERRRRPERARRRRRAPPPPPAPTVQPAAVQPCEHDRLVHGAGGAAAAAAAAACADDEQIALALQARELAARRRARAKFKSSEDLIHRLFVCIAGVADQLQTNFAADLRNILKAVFLMNQTPDEAEPEAEPEAEAEAEAEEMEAERKPGIEYEPSEDQVIQTGSSFDSINSAEEVYADSSSSSSRASLSRPAPAARPAAPPACPQRPARAPPLGECQTAANGGERCERAPEWVPDVAAADCMRCGAHFTHFRRRHHCRNCGKVFCAACSSHSAPLPRYGQPRPVRVCAPCFASLAPRAR